MGMGEEGLALFWVCRRQFQILGGEATIATLQAVYSADKDIMGSIAILQSAAKQGQTHNACRCCVIT